MLIISTVPEAIGLMLVGILLLGTWPAVWHQVEQSGRLPSHTFLDYTLTYLACSAACALTLGQLGPAAVSPLGQSLNFLDQLQQQNWQLVLFALAGGACLALGDLALQYSIALCGLSIGPPILNSITIIVGVVLAYFLDGGINKPQLVFTGAAAAALAVVVGAAAHFVTLRAAAADGSKGAGSNSNSDPAQHQQQQLCRLQDDSAHGRSAAAPAKLSTVAGGGTSSRSSSNRRCPSVSEGDAHRSTGSLTVSDTDACKDSTPRDCELGTATAAHVQQQQQQQQQQGPLNPVPPLQRHRSITASRKSSLYLGLALTVIGGIIYGCFMPAFQIAANDPFRLLQAPTPPLSVFTTFFYFAVGFTLVSGTLNVWLMYRPPLGIKPSSLAAYLRDNRGRGLSVASGLLAGAGDLTQFMGGQTAGYAAAMMVMAYPVVGVLWGLLRFKELRGPGPKGEGARPGVRWGLVLVVVQVVLYVLSVGLLSGSAELRSH